MAREYTKEQVVLAALAPSECATHSPVQVQKLLFLIDALIPELVGGLNIIQGPSYKIYFTTPAGQKRGEKILNQFPQAAQKFIHEVSQFVRILSFNQLVSAIYHQFPHMRENSVFQKQ
jgi:hypothetical protein